MKHLNTLNMKQFIGFIDDKKFDRIIYANSRTELTENDILYLQEIFLLSGFHCIKFLNLRLGKEIVENILDSLDFYNNIQFLSDCDYSGLYNKLSAAYFDSNLEECLLDLNWPDILIIELSDVLISKPWFGKFLFLINDFNFINSTPVVLIS